MKYVKQGSLALQRIDSWRVTIALISALLAMSGKLFPDTPMANWALAGIGVAFMVLEQGFSRLRSKLKEDAAFFLCNFDRKSLLAAHEPVAMIYGMAYSPEHVAQYRAVEHDDSIAISDAERERYNSWWPDCVIQLRAEARILAGYYGSTLFDSTNREYYILVLWIAEGILLVGTVALAFLLPGRAVPWKVIPAFLAASFFILKEIKEQTDALRYSKSIRSVIDGVLERIEKDEMVPIEELKRHADQCSQWLILRRRTAGRPPNWVYEKTRPELETKFKNVTEVMCETLKKQFPGP